jgi:hypothetical protein
MFAVNWVSTFMLANVIGELAQSGSNSKLMFSIYGVMSAGYIFPFVLIYAVLRLFIKRNV